MVDTSASTPSNDTNNVVVAGLGYSLVTTGATTVRFIATRLLKLEEPSSLIKFNL